MSETLTPLERTIVLGLDGQDPEQTAALRAATDQDVIGVAGATVNLLNRGLLSNEDEGLFPTANGIRAAYGATA